MDERISEFVLMEQKLNLAKERSEFVLYYQPYFDIMSGNLTGMESLLRWQSEDDGLVSPGKFIPVLEETRNIIPIGRWIIETVCKQLQDWSIANLEVVPVSINLSPIQFAQEDLLSVIEGIVSDYGVFPWSRLPRGSLSLQANTPGMDVPHHALSNQASVNGPLC